MIKMTLEFANADEAIAALTKLANRPLEHAAAAVTEHNNRQRQAETPLPEIVPPAEAPKPKAEKTASPPAAAVSSQPETAAAPPASSPVASASAPAAEAIDYAVLQKAVFTLAGKSRDAAIALNQSFGVKTMKELPAERWPEALAAVNAKIAELG